MPNNKLTQQDKNQFVHGNIQVKDLIRVINAGTKALELHKSLFDADEEQKALKAKMYRAMNTAASMLVIVLGQHYCTFANTLNDVPESAVKRRLLSDFEIANR